MKQTNSVPKKKVIDLNLIFGRSIACSRNISFR